MLKKMSIRKITVTTFALFIMALFYFFPSVNNDLKVEKKYEYDDSIIKKSVYLVDKYEYVSKLMLPISSTNTIDMVKEKLEYLIIDSEKIEKIPNGFRPIIPMGTKILNIDLKENTLIINFSKEILNISKVDEEKMIETIIYSLTEIEGIKNIIIKVDGVLLNKLPKSEKILPEILDRNYGINKIYDFTSLYNLSKTTIYYVNVINDNVYYTPVTNITNDEREKITVIIDELKSSLVYQSNLSSYLSSVAELKNYEIIENTMHLTFNEKILNNLKNKDILEEVKYTISMSIKENYDVENVIFYVGDEEITEYTEKTLE
jgi:germination protein M